MCTVGDTKVYRFDTKLDIVATPSHCSTHLVISGFLSSHLGRLSSFVSSFITAVHFRVSNGTYLLFHSYSGFFFPHLAQT